MSSVSAPPTYGCSVYGRATGSCCDALANVNINITSGATVCQTTSSDSTKTLQACLLAVQGNTNTSVACNFSGKASGGAAGRRGTMLGSVALAGLVALTVLGSMA